MFLRKNLSNLFLLSFLTLFSLIFTAQSSVVTGLVIDENKEGMPGVTVKIDGMSNGTTTNLDGKYSINIENDS